MSLERTARVQSYNTPAKLLGPKRTPWKQEIANSSSADVPMIVSFSSLQSTGLSLR